MDEIRLELLKLKPKLRFLADALKIKDSEEKLKKLEAQTLEISFWSDLEKSKKALSDIKSINSKIKEYNFIEKNFQELEILLELSIEEQDNSYTNEIENNLKKIKKSIENQLLTTLFTGKYDSHNAILTLHAGAGGTESQDWVEMLFRMYTHWAEKHKYKVKVLDCLEGEEAGIKSISFIVEGTNAYGFLKSENGVHRLVRISPFDSSGRRHTSFASLEVIPEIDDEIKIEISPDDLKMDVYRASGAGGQHVNKTSSAVRLTHIPTGIIVSCQNERSQFQNRDTALKILKSKLIELKEKEHLEKIEDIKGVQKEISWGSQIRSYTFMPYTLVKDHRTEYETGNIGAVMDGEIDEFIEAYLKNLI